MPVSEENIRCLVGQSRRRSVDVGGLALALGTQGLGQGWGGWDQAEENPCYAELLSDMYTHTHLAVDSEEESAPIVIPEDTRIRLIQSLDSWNFEPHKLPDEEVMYCAIILFETLLVIEGVSEAAQVDMGRITELLRSLRRAYRVQNSYHNFQHALDVLQAIHRFLSAAGRVPPVTYLLNSQHTLWKPHLASMDPLASCLTPLDLFCLYVASIGHDVGHPGFTNMFMKNAKAPLSSLYDDKSALEHLHCTILLHVLRRQGLASLVDNPSTGATFRKLMLETVLATDMRVHGEFMARFTQLVEGHETDDWSRRVLLCQALIKCADISNPCRPLGVSQHWANALADEWTSQAVLEQYLNMPTSVNSVDGPLEEARSQVFFIQTFASPLFSLTARGMPSCLEYALQCESNLAVWKQRVAEHSQPADPAKDLSDVSSITSRTPSQLPEEYLKAFPMTLPASLLHPDQTDEHSISDWSSITSRRSASNASFSSSSRSSSRSPVSCTPVVLPPFSTASTSTGSSADRSSPPISPTDGLSAAPSRAVSLTSGAMGLLGMSVSSVVGSGTAAIRAAYKVSVRKKPSFNNRNSWSPGPRGPNGTLPLRVEALGSNAPSARREMTVVADGLAP
ncbi:hypothetical protein OF83DRAFT_1167180 [Amylostereum chailletii]|nr:hypothetical protein OF83DRAFT_1167180 [Amylostereum chailletii]